MRISDWSSDVCSSDLANKQRSADAAETVDWEAMATTRRSVREYLDTLDDAAWGAASEVKPKFVSRSDPAAQWTGAHKGHAFFAYSTNYLIDLDHAVIVDVEPSRSEEQTSELHEHMRNLYAVFCMEKKINSYR